MSADYLQPFQPYAHYKEKETNVFQK